MSDEFRNPPPGPGRAQGEERRGSAVERAVAAVVGFCVAHARLVVAVALVLAAACSIYAISHFSLNSDINALLPTNVEWRRHELAFERAFRRFDLIEAVVEAPTPELATAATSDLVHALEADRTRFESVANVGDSSFFQRHGFLFQSTDELKRTAAGLIEGEPIIHDMATDRSLRGLVAGLEDALLGLQAGRLKQDDFARPLDMFSDTLEKVLAGGPSSFSWRVLIEGKPASPNELRGFVEIHPVLDFKSLEPGHEAEATIRRLAAPIAAKYGAGVRLTGPVAINDEQFGSIKENAFRNGAITVAIVVFILWLALRSGRLILALVVNVVVGLAATAALGTLMIGAFNVISIYFAVLFIGIGVDFAIQFSVRYRDERHRLGDLETAIRSAGSRVAMPLALASLATAAGFFSFLPTDYRGVSELGLIAGMGMLIAFLTSVTLLPALLKLTNPPGEPETLGYTQLAPVDNYLAKHRTPIIVGTLLVVACLSPALYWLRFDFNPIDLQNPKSEAIATYLELQKDRSVEADAVQAVAPSLEQANAIAERLAKLPQVASVRTLSTFIPSDQDEKIPIIRSAATKLEGAFEAKEAATPPTDAENIDALNEGAQRLTESAGEQQGPGATAMRRLAALLSKVAQASPEIRDQASETLIRPLNADLADLQAALEVKPLTQADLPRAIVDDWIGVDGKARLSIMPKANPGDIRATRSFARAVLAVEPNATEGQIAILKAGDMILWAFVEAGAWALASIAVLLFLFLRRLGDVMLTLVPLALAGLVTMQAMTFLGMPFNFANIIALPLLLGVGVAFKIYYIVAWREGATQLLQTPLTRAVFYSALTTATAFGSLWFSSNPGASSMGKLLALSLICTLAAAVIFQPILMGKPRTRADRNN
ncbi:MAG TPA: MMPL family transporter [Roseiarcus sp.]|nr:MMPL family transporter [Roseiarcus sp.]